MNNFRLPYHLIVQEGIFEQVDQVMSDCVPDIKDKSVIIVTDENLQKLFGSVVEALQEDYHGKAVFMAVRGNCDFLCDYPAEGIFSYEGVRILMLHGHTRNVKHGTAALEAYARVQGVDLILYGHTHRAEDRYLPMEEGRPLRLFNPGSIGAGGRDIPRFGYLDIRNG